MGLVQIIERSSLWLTYFLKIFKIRYLRYPCRVNSNIKGLFNPSAGAALAAWPCLGQSWEICNPSMHPSPRWQPLCRGVQSRGPTAITGTGVHLSFSHNDRWRKTWRLLFVHLPKEFFGRSGYFIQTLNSFVLSFFRHYQKLWIFLCAKKQICFRLEIIKIKLKSLRLFLKSLKPVSWNKQEIYSFLRNVFSSWQEFRNLLQVPIIHPSLNFSTKNWC